MRGWAHHHLSVWVVLRRSLFLCDETGRPTSLERRRTERRRGERKEDGSRCERTLLTSHGPSGRRTRKRGLTRRGCLEGSGGCWPCSLRRLCGARRIEAPARITTPADAALTAYVRLHCGAGLQRRRPLRRGRPPSAAAECIHSRSHKNSSYGSSPAPGPLRKRCWCISLSSNPSSEISVQCWFWACVLL